MTITKKKLAIGGTLVGLAALAWATTPSTARDKPAPPAKAATAIPHTPTADPNSHAKIVAAWLSVVGENAPHVSATITNVAATCTGIGSLASQAARNCKSAADANASAVVRFQSALDNQGAPGCLKAADTELRAGLKDEFDADFLIGYGVDRQDMTYIDQATAKITSAGAHFVAANAAIVPTAC